MKIETKKSYNIVFDDNSDVGSGSLAYFFAKILFKANLEAGLEPGVPFLSDMGVSVSNTAVPSNRMVILSYNTSRAESEDIILNQHIAEVIKFILSNAYGVNPDIRRVKAICKRYKKTQTYRKYLHCFYVLVSELEDDKADLLVKDMLSFGLPFYVKVRELIKILSSLSRSNLNKLLFYRGVWGEDTLKDIYFYLIGDRPLPDYVVRDYEEDIKSSNYKVNLVNFGLSIGKSQLNKFVLKNLMESVS